MTKSNIIVVSIIILVAIGVIGYAGYQSYLQNTQEPEQTQENEQEEENAPQIDRINAQHQYNSETGEHIVAGTLQTPTICHVLETDVDVNEETDPATAIIAYELVNTSETCAQAIGEQRFKVTFEAPGDADIQATLNGESVELNLVPVAEGEDLSDFDVYIKG